MQILSELHGHIRDAFNEHGRQTMAPHHEADRDEPKLVPKDRFFAPPAKPNLGG